MWTREQLKTNAKAILSGTYWWAFLVCFVFTIIAGIGNGSSRINSSLPSRNNTTITQSHIVDIDDFDGADQLTNAQKQEFQEVIDSYLNPISIGLGVAGAVISLLLFVFKKAYMIFVSNPLTVGYNQYFIKQHYGDVNFGHLFSGFTGGKYMARVKVMFFKSLFEFLWGLLFVIPGIIKSYSYFLIPYILADNPDIGKDRAFEISMKTMDGEKWDLFVLQLSFIGWYLLGILCCCIGIYFVNPYAMATYSEFYLVMRQKAIDKGIATPEEFNLTEV